MPASPPGHCRDLPEHLGVDEAIRRWPRDLPLAALVSSGSHDLSRWSILACPTAELAVHDASDIPSISTRSAPEPNSSAAPWFRGGHLVQLDYELGGRVDPGPRFRTPQNRVGSVWRVPWGLIRDHARGRWLEFGDRPFDLRRLAAPEAAPGAWSLAALQSEVGREQFEAWVERAIEYIRAGDIFQVNLAHHLRGSFRGSARALAAELLGSARPLYGAYLESAPGPQARSIISLSPERFLSLDPMGTLRARPMKGTRPAHADPRELEANPKDRAELDMIIDLMRNDLGRVSRQGSVRVTRPRVIEAHGRVWQASGEVEGHLRPGLGMREVIEATFPPGSVTGAPKYRAREIIDEFEPRARGPYCGCIGALSQCGAAELSVAIRTLTIEGEATAPGMFTRAEASYPVGAGIVADSSPRSEWEETLHKAEGLMRVAGAGQ